MSKHFTVLIVGLIVAAVCSPLVAQTYAFQQLTIPYAPNADIWANGINNRGAIVGTFLNNRHAQKYYGFKRNANGFVERPFAAIPPHNTTTATGITDHGLIVGWAYTGTSRQGFLLYHGIFTYYNIPPGPDTAILGINNKGDFVGSLYYIRNSGFINSNGVVTQIKCPNSLDTFANGIAADGTVVGTCGFYGGAATAAGFIRGPAGQYKIIQVPGARNTGVNGINNLAHKVVGSYDGHGFVYDYITDTTATVDYPGGFSTTITGINSHGVIVGYAIMHDAQGNNLPVLSFIGTPQ